MRCNCGAAHSRGFLVTNPTIPGIHLRPSLGVERRGWKSALVPLVAEIAHLRCKRLRNVVHHPVMQSHPQRKTSQRRERNIVPRQFDRPESVALLEVAQSTALLLPIGEIGV